MSEGKEKIRGQFMGGILGSVTLVIVESQPFTTGQQDPRIVVECHTGIMVVRKIG